MRDRGECADVLADICNRLYQMHKSGELGERGYKAIEKVSSACRDLWWDILENKEKE